MRRLTFFLCFLMVVVLCWTIVSAVVLTPTERNEAVLPEAGVTVEAVSTSFKASLVAAGICAEDTVWISHEPLSAGIDAGARSTTAILSQSNRRVEFEFIEIAAGMVIESLLPTSDQAYRPRQIYL
jgi:hypothetical protein